MSFVKNRFQAIRDRLSVALQHQKFACTCALACYVVESPGHAKDVNGSLHSPNIYAEAENLPP